MRGVPALVVAALVSAALAGGGPAAAAARPGDARAPHKPLAAASMAAAGTRAAAARVASGGTWGTAQEVPGTAALNIGGAAQVNSVSCGSAGNCSAGGF
jgi:hypothetical protein